MFHKINTCDNGFFECRRKDKVSAKKYYFYFLLYVHYKIFKNNLLQEFFMISYKVNTFQVNRFK